MYMHIWINLSLHCDFHPFYICKTEANFGNIDCSESLLLLLVQKACLIFSLYFKYPFLIQIIITEIM